MAAFEAHIETRLFFLCLRLDLLAAVPTQQSSAHALSLEKGSHRQPEIF